MWRIQQQQTAGVLNEVNPYGLMTTAAVSLYDVLPQTLLISKASAENSVQHVVCVNFPSI